MDMVASVFTEDMIHLPKATVLFTTRTELSWGTPKKT